MSPSRKPSEPEPRLGTRPRVASKSYVLGLLREYCLTPDVPSDVAQAVLEVMVHWGVLTENSQGHFEIAGKAATTLDLPDKAGSALKEALVGMLRRDRQLEMVFGRLVLGTRASGSGSPGSGGRFASSSISEDEQARRRRDQATRALVEMEWNADAIVAKFEEQLRDQATLIVSCVLQQMRLEAGKDAQSGAHAVVAGYRSEDAGHSGHGELRRTSNGWRISYLEEAAEFSDLNGLRCIESLLRCPEVAVRVELLDSQDTSAASRSADRDLRFDRKAWTDAKLKFEGLVQELDLARQSGDPRAIAEAEQEVAAFGEHLERDRGWQSKGRTLDPAADRVRQRVFRALEYALKKIAEKMPGLGRHLEASILDKSGWSPRYHPDEKVIWVFTRD
jgi:hypothetical protein